MDKMEEYHEQDIKNSINYIWIILSIFVPFVIYYVMYKISRSVDDHMKHKKALYKSYVENIPGDLKKDLDDFPTTAISYYWLFLLSGFFEFLMGSIYTINLKNLYIPTPIVLAVLINFFFLVLLVDVISKRFYVHQLIEDDINHHINNSSSSVASFKKRNGVVFLMLSILTLTIYIYVYLAVITKEYLSHLDLDYNVMEHLK
ncbi:MAG: hypothetical protein M1542_02170 [Thermotogae bacterium]|jgi:hypothetical protein|nr:hypothetical protein [Thermotogota bacterium]